MRMNYYFYVDAIFTVKAGKLHNVQKNDLP